MKILLVSANVQLSQNLEHSLHDWNVTATSSSIEAIGYYVAESFTAVLIGTDDAGRDFLSQWIRLQTLRSKPGVLVTADDPTRCSGIVRAFGLEECLCCYDDVSHLRARILAAVEPTAVQDEIRLYRGSSVASWKKPGEGGVKISLTGIEARILKQLAENFGNVVKREELYESVFGREWSPFDRSLDTHVSNLRRKFGRPEFSLPQILSVRGIGYQLIDAEESWFLTFLEGRRVLTVT